MIASDVQSVTVEEQQLQAADSNEAIRVGILFIAKCFLCIRGIWPGFFGGGLVHNNNARKEVWRERKVTQTPLTGKEQKYKKETDGDSGTSCPNVIMEDEVDEMK